MCAMSDRRAYDREQEAKKRDRERITRRGRVGMGGLQTQVDDIIIRQGRPPCCCKKKRIKDSGVQNRV